MAEFKKDADYGKVNDFVAEGEITVTITLAEYRDLVSSKAVSEEKINKAIMARLDREKENEALRKENEALRNELYCLKDPKASSFSGRIEYYQKLDSDRQ